MEWIRFPHNLIMRARHNRHRLDLETPCSYVLMALYGFVRIVALVNSAQLGSLIMVSNKVSLQNQLQNPRASDPEESNNPFDAIRGLLL